MPIKLILKWILYLTLQKVFIYWQEQFFLNEYYYYFIFLHTTFIPFSVFPKINSNLGLSSRNKIYNIIDIIAGIITVRVRALQLLTALKKITAIPVPKSYPYNNDKFKIAIYLPLFAVGVISARIVAANLIISKKIINNYGPKNPIKNAAMVLVIIKV
jgi:hypothetical protein